MSGPGPVASPAWRSAAIVLAVVVGGGAAVVSRATAQQNQNVDDVQMDDVLGKTEIDLQLEERKRRLGLAEVDSLAGEESSEDEMASSAE